jgi:hypothetical protein
MSRHIFCFLIFILFHLPFAAAQNSARATLDSSHAETGNPFVVHLSVPKSAGEPRGIDFSVWENLVPQQNILKQTEWNSEGQFFTRDLTIIFFDEDSLALPPLPIRLNGGEIALTNPLEIAVLPTPSPDDLNDMADIKDIRREPALWTDYLPWAIAFLVLALLVVLAAWLIGRAQKRRNQAALSRSVELPPHELALKKLNALAQKQLWQKGLVKEHCAELTFVVREYLEKRYRVPALESTSEEMLKDLQKTDFPQTFRSELNDLLTKADLVKFAKATPPETFQEESMTFARKIILETKPITIHQSTNHQ